MPFHFKRAESPARAVRRVCRGRIGGALARLRQAGRPAAVHGARKEIKKLRAILRLVRGEIGRVGYRRTTGALHRAARRLAAPRDARALLKAFERAAGPAVRRFPQIQKALQKNHRRETRGFWRAGSPAAAGKILRKAGRRVGRLKIKAAGWMALGPGLRQSYRRGRQAGNAARRQPSPEHLHEWRKQVKDFGCQLRLLCPAWPASVRARIRQLERLGEQLGEDHDLVLLQQFITEHRPRPAGEAAALHQRIVSRRKKLGASIFKLGVRLYAERPAVVCARLGRHWNAWRRRRKGAHPAGERGR